MASHLAAMSAAYRDPAGPNIEYRDPLVRLAYLYRHAPIHADIVETAIRAVDGLSGFLRNRIRETGALRVCSFGGGPGTELLALVKYLIRYFPDMPFARLAFTTLDREAAWTETWGVMRDQVDMALTPQFGGDVRKWPFIVERTFSSVNISNTSHYADLGLALDHDLFILSFVFSELHDPTQQAQTVNLLRSMAGASSTPAWFLVTDRSDLRTRRVVQGVFDGLSPSVAARSMHAIEGAMEIDERVTDLGESFAQLSGLGEWPRLRANALCLNATRNVISV
jgi:hypothetical protein